MGGAGDRQTDRSQDPGPGQSRPLWSSGSPCARLTTGGTSRGQESSAALTCWPLRALLPGPPRLPLPRAPGSPPASADSPSLPASPPAPHPPSSCGPSSRDTAGAPAARPSPGPADLVPDHSQLQGQAQDADLWAEKAAKSHSGLARTQDSRELGTRPGPVLSTGLEASPPLPTPTTLITVQPLPAPEGPPPPQTLPASPPHCPGGCPSPCLHRRLMGETIIAPASPRVCCPWRAAPKLREETAGPTTQSTVGL